MYRIVFIFSFLFIIIEKTFAVESSNDFAVWRYFLIESSNAQTGKKVFELWQVSFQWKEMKGKKSPHIEFEVVVTEIHKQNNEYRLGRFVIHRFDESKNKAVKNGNKIKLEVGYSHYEMQFNDNGMIENISGGHINPVNTNDVSFYRLSNDTVSLNLRISNH